MKRNLIISVVASGMSLLLLAGCPGSVDTQGFGFDSGLTTTTVPTTSSLYDSYNPYGAVVTPQPQIVGGQGFPDSGEFAGGGDGFDAGGDTSYDGSGYFELDSDGDGWSDWS